MSKPENRDDIQRLLSMTDEESLQNALSDPDNQPLTDEQIKRAKPVCDVKALRKKLDMTQEDFCKTYKIPLGTLRDWERHNTTPDKAALSYLHVIEREPEIVRKTFLR
jgi:putative transcriptional regulator